MKHSLSLLFASIFIAFFQPGNVAGATRMLPLLSQALYDNRGSRGEGDIEMGSDPSFQCPPGTAVAPHPEKCELYYTCYSGYPVTLWQCYSNYLFDLTYSGCNYPEETICGDRQRPGSNEVIRKGTTISAPLPYSQVFTCPTSSGFFPISPDDCFQHYYTCASGVAYITLCPPNSLFDPVTLTCRSQNDVSCQNPAFTCEADGFYPVEGECTGVYFVCASGVPYETVCPSDGIFDPDRHICASPNTVPCAQDSTSTSTTKTSTTSSTTPSTTTSSTTPSTTTTSTTPSTATTTSTPSTTTTTSTTASTPTTPSGEFSCPAKDGKYPDPTNCHAYYVCISGVAFPSNCPENGCFEAASQQCSPTCSNCIDFFFGYF